MEPVRVMPWPKRPKMEGRPSSPRALSETECRTLELVALGLSSRNIAQRLSVSHQAVTYHIGNLFRKFETKNRAGLVARAYATGVMAPGSWPPQVSSVPRPATLLVRSVGEGIDQGDPGPDWSTPAPSEEHASSAVMESG